jgi:hypothetical protein
MEPYAPNRKDLSSTIKELFVSQAATRSLLLDTRNLTANRCTLNTEETAVVIISKTRLRCISTMREFPCLERVQQ